MMVGHWQSQVQRHHTRAPLTLDFPVDDIVFYECDNGLRLESNPETSGFWFKCMLQGLVWEPSADPDPSNNEFNSLVSEAKCVLGV
jgi:hypothetical protein